jgi:hypothetical protein
MKDKLEQFIVMHSIPSVSLRLRRSGEKSWKAGKRRKSKEYFSGTFPGPLLFYLFSAYPIFSMIILTGAGMRGLLKRRGTMYMNRYPS